MGWMHDTLTHMQQDPLHGGSNLGNGAGALAEMGQPSHGRALLIMLDLPPLATLLLVPERQATARR